MNTIECTVEEILIEDERGIERPGVKVICQRCDHSAQSFGTSDASVRRCCALLREECSMDEENFYKADR